MSVSDLTPAMRRALWSADEDGIISQDCGGPFVNTMHALEARGLVVLQVVESTLQAGTTRSEYRWVACLTDTGRELVSSR